VNIQQQIVEKIRKLSVMDNKNFKIENNPDFLHRKSIEAAIEKNDGYCCCAVEKNDDTKCMCKDFREQHEYGFCHCGRYFKVLNSPKVCLCGSTRFKDKFLEVAREFTLKGYIVTMPMVFAHSGDEITEWQKEYLDEVHKAKIADADLIFIVNCGKYVGESTKSEIDWALQLGKKIEYLEK
jgi:hypothetical protein